MDDLIEHYNALSASVIPLDLRLKLFPCEMTQNERYVEGHEALLAALAQYEGDAWLECIDAVRYKAGDATKWLSPTTNHRLELGENVRILNGELAGEFDGIAGSLQIRHHHLETWHLTETLEHGQVMSSFDDVFRGIERNDPTLPDSGGLDLRYRTYWDAENGCPAVVRFVGFEQSGESRDG